MPMSLAEAARHDAVAMFAQMAFEPVPGAAPAQRPYRAPGRNGYYGDGVLHGQVTADGEHMVLLTTGSAQNQKNIAERLHLLTAHGESALDEHGQPTGARYYPLSWATIVQLGFIFNHDGHAVWKPRPELAEWVIRETIRRTSAPPAIPRCWPDRFTPYPHQLDGAAAIASAGKYLLGDDPGPQPVTTPVWTPDGWAEIGSLVPGDTVYDSSGQPVPVRAVKYFGPQPVYRVTFSDGTSTLATSTHRWHVWSKNDRKRDTGGRVMSTSELAESGLKYPDRSAKYYLPQQPVMAGGSTGNVPLDPYAYGALLGNGSLGAVDRGQHCLSITGPDDEILSAVGTAANALGTTWRWNRPADRCQSLSFHRKGRLQETLDGLGALVHSASKYVHPLYLRAGVTVRRALLAGLLDTDGSVTDRSGAGVEFSSSSPQLAADVAWLARSVGAVVTEAKPQPAGYVREDGIKVQCLLKHRLHMRFPADGPNPFTLPRKADAWAAQAARVQRRNPPRTFQAIEPAGIAEVCCIELDARSTRVYLTDIALIPTHNTGKTVTALLGIEARRLAGTVVFPMVIVVPSWEVARVWEDHIRDWMPHWPGPVLHKGARRARVQGWKGQDYILITTYATLRRDAPDMSGLLVKIRAKAVVADECHLARNPRAKQSRALWRVAHYAPTLVWASGTLITHDFGDVYQPLFTMDPLTWPSKDDLKDRYLATRRTDYDETILGLRPEMEAEFFAALSGQLRRIAKGDVLDQLPDKIYSVRRPEMPAHWRHAYDTMEKQMLAELPDGGELPVMSILEQLTRLSQLASCAADVAVEYLPDERTGLLKPHYHVTLKPPCWKADALLDLLAERPDQPTAVFAESRQLAMITGEYCRKAGLRTGYVVGAGDTGPYGEEGVQVTNKTRRAAVEDFQAGKLDVILCTLGAGGLGITLTASNCAVMLQRSFQFDLAIQPEDRVHRIGAEIHDHVEIVDFVTLNSVDQRRREVLRDKAGQLGQLVRDPRIVRALLGGLS